MGTIADLNEMTAATLAIDDLLMIRDISTPTDKDKKIKAGAFPFKFGTPVAGRVAMWKDANSIEPSAFPLTVPTPGGTAALLEVAQTLTALKTFTGGIRMNAAQQTLDHFDYGQWPVLPVLSATTTAPTGVSYTSRAGIFARLGKVVLYSFLVRVSGVGSGGAGSASVSLPFPVAAGSAEGTYGTAYLAGTTGIDLPGVPASTAFSLSAGASIGLFTMFYDNLQRAFLDYSGIKVGSDLGASGWYLTA